MSKYRVTFTMGIPFEFIAEEAWNEGSAKEMALQAFENLSPGEVENLLCNGEIVNGVHVEELPAFYVKMKE